MNTKLIALALMPFFLLACAGDKVGKNEIFSEPTNECSASQIKDQFIVHWKTGEVTVEHARSREDFLKNIVEEHADEIQKSEHDYTIVLETFDEEDSDDGGTITLDGTENWGQEMIEAPSLWSQNKFGQGVTVAVIDSGADITHPELKNQLFVNDLEIAGNNLDDDNNGFIDDIHGFDFFHNTGEITDFVGHGSHVSGIVAAEHGVGVTNGVAPLAKIMPLNFMASDGTGTLSAAIGAINYAVNNGAQIINASWGGSSCSKVLESTVESLSNQGILFMAAAGNAGQNLEFFPEFPAAFVVENQITVGASTFNDFTAAFSNKSRTFVHLVAPGQDIFSTVPDDPTIKARKSGTSMATPFVSGVAAILMGAFPQATPSQVKNAILNSVDLGNHPVVTEGRLNARKAHDLLSQAFN